MKEYKISSKNRENARTISITKKALRMLASGPDDQYSNNLWLPSQHGESSASSKTREVGNQKVMKLIRSLQPGPW
jgi:hypothetical protein